MTEFHDLEILARTIRGEADGEPQEGKLAVAWVVLNRFHSGKWFSAASIADTCLKPLQFSCWNRGGTALARDGEISWPCLNAAISALAGIDDPTHGATHYYADTISPPPWAAGKVPTTKIGHHLFFKDID